MEKQEIDRREFFNGLTVTLTVSLDWENPNSVYGIWEEAEHHEGGATVKDEHGSSGYWVSMNYTPAELTRDYAKQGRENPSKEAYESLQRELHHYLYGSMFQVTATVTLNGEELSFDSIGFDFSDWVAGPGESLEDRAREIAKDHFDVRGLIRQARDEAQALIKRLERIA